jgi:hypothetical protein
LVACGAIVLEGARELSGSAQVAEAVAAIARVTIASLPEPLAPRA